LSSANELLHKLLLGNISSPCQKDIDSLASVGIGGFQLTYAINRSSWINGTTSDDREYMLYQPGTDAYTLYAAHPSLTVAQLFKNSPSTKAQAALPGTPLAGNIYFNPGFVNGLSIPNTAALLMHEILHTLGAIDPQIQSALF